MDMDNRPVTPRTPPDAPAAGMIPGKGRLATRFRRINILLFVLAFCVMALIMMLLLNGFMDGISEKYAGMQAASTAEALSAHIARELELMSNVAHTKAITEWMSDEDDPDKIASAFDELANMVGDLYSFNLYIGLTGSHNQYVVDTGYAPANIRQVDVLDSNDPEDAWFFNCIRSGADYKLDINADHFMQRKRVWLDYKVVRGGATLGVFSTGLEFSHVAGELFSQYSSNGIRGLIIDENYVIHMDSSLMTDREFLYSEYSARINEEFSDAGLIAAIESQVSNGIGYNHGAGDPDVVKISAGRYRYLTVMPIQATGWSVVILSGGSALFDMTYFIPIIVTVLALLILVALVTTVVNYRLIFSPLSKISGSLADLPVNLDGTIYGVERDDELGELSKTIRDLFTKANKDALTGIYNRRFMETNLDNIMAVLARSGGMLSLLMVDIDFFKRYNDTYGHDQGDVCLRSVAQALSHSVLRASDFVARYGGEEFIAILTNTDEHGARQCAERLIRNVDDLDIPHAGNEAVKYVTISVGVTTGVVSYSQKWEDYVKRADEALYKSKEGGRNRFTYLHMEY